MVLGFDGGQAMIDGLFDLGQVCALLFARWRVVARNRFGNGLGILALVGVYPRTGHDVDAQVVHDLVGCDTSSGELGQPPIVDLHRADVD